MSKRAAEQSEMQRISSLKTEHKRKDEYKHIHAAISTQHISSLTHSLVAYYL